MARSLFPRPLQCVSQLLPCTSDSAFLPWRLVGPVTCLPSRTVCSVQFSHSVMSNSLRPHGLQQARLPCPSPAPGAYSSSCPLSQWCHPTISSSVIPFSSHLHSFPASRSFQMSQFFASGGQMIGVGDIVYRTSESLPASILSPGASWSYHVNNC